MWLTVHLPGASTAPTAQELWALSLCAGPVVLSLLCSSRFMAVVGVAHQMSSAAPMKSVVQIATSAELFLESRLLADLKFIVSGERGYADGVAHRS